MTGQVKEDILSRFGELGIRVNNGLLAFDPVILHPSEFLSSPQTFEYFDVNLDKKYIELEEKSLAFTVCQVPIIYKKSDIQKVSVEFTDGTTKIILGKQLDEDTTQHIFRRTHKVKQLCVNVLK